MGNPNPDKRVVPANAAPEATPHPEDGTADEIPQDRLQALAKATMQSVPGEEVVADIADDLGIPRGGPTM